MPDNTDIDRQAAEWAAATCDRDPSGDEKTRLDRWLAADERHFGAYMKALAVVTRVEKLSRPAETPYVSPAERPSRRRVIAAAVAGLVLAGGAASFLWPSQSAVAYATAKGENRIVTLADGSRLTLNTQTKTEVRYSSARRDIALVEGEALFDVAKNKERPFIVTARGIEVRAVGTSFSVQSLPGRPLEVLVREGIVRIDRPGAKPVFVSADTHAAIADNGTATLTRLSREETANRLAWQNGQIYFRDRPLLEVSREFARYSPTAIIIDDPATARMIVSGLYRADNPAGFAKAAAASLRLKAVEARDGVHLLHK